MVRLARRTSPVIFLLFLFVSGCDQLSQQKVSRQENAQALESYFKNESTLKQTAWRFYATQDKDSKLHAYLIFPPRQIGVSRAAPVESELRRLCPDSNFHSFWRDTGMETIELVLIKDVQANNGKAKRLLQITCDSSFDLIAFEKGSSDPAVSEPVIDVERDRSNWYGQMIVALREDNSVSLERLLNERPHYIDMRNDRGESLLHFSKSGEAAGLLLEKGARVDAKTRWGATPLIYAADFPGTDFASVLIKAGADVNHTSQQSETPLNRAYNLEMAKLLIKHGAIVPKDALLNPARSGRIELVQYLYNLGARIDAKNLRGQTVLHQAAVGSSESYAKGQVEIARWLIQQGVDVNALDRFGETPYDATIWHDNPNQEMLKLLSDNGGRSGKN